MTKIIQRHDTTANWTAANPVLAAGEMGIETDTNKFKFGDGVTAWSNLPYAAGEGGGSGSGTTLTSTDGTTTYSKLALGDTLSVTDTSTKELNGVTQTGGTLNSELEFTGASGASLKMTEKYSLSTADSWEFQIKYKHNGGGTFPTIFGYASGSDYKVPTLIYENGHLKMYMSSNGGSWNLNAGDSGLALTSGTIYYFKVGFTGSQYYIKYNTTGWSSEFTTQWTLNSTTKVYCSDYFMLMNLSLNGSNYYNTGTMYLQDTALIINGTETWRGAKIIPGDIILDANINEVTDQVATLTSSVSTLEISVKNKSDKILNMADFYRIGTPTVSGSTYTSSANNYLACNISSLNMSQPYEIVICLHVKKNISGYSNGISILGTNNGLNYQGLKIALNELGEVIPYMSTNGTSWDYNSSASSLRLNSVGTYYIKFEHTSTSYYMYYSIDNGNTWTTAYSKTGFDGALLNSGYFVIGGNNGDYLRNSSFDISKFYIKQGGNYIITGTLNSTKPVSPATTTSLGVVQPDGTSITISETGVISGQDVKTFTGYSDTGTLVLKSINGVLQWVAES